MISQEMLNLGRKKSCIRELFDFGKAQAEVVGPENIFDYSIGNPSVPTPKPVSDTIAQMVKEDGLKIHSYTSAHGCKHVRDKVAENLTERAGMKIRTENLFFTCGAAPAIVSVIRALSVENAEFLLIAPYFAEYPVYIGYNGAKVTVVEPDTNTFQINFEDLERKITENTQGIIVNTPNNPSGVIYSRETLKKLGDILERKSKETAHPIYIISDEPYRELAYDNTEVPFIPAIYPDTIICYSFSKSLSMPGERIGYVCVCDCVTDGEDIFYAVAGAARSIGHVCAPSLMQWTIAEICGVFPDLTVYDNNRKRLYSALTDMGYKCVYPQGAFYMLVKSPLKDAKEFSDLAKEENLLIVPTDDFGLPGYFRISTCVSPAMIEKSLPAFERTIKKVKE